METCAYENCDKPGIFNNGTLCRNHKNTVVDILTFNEYNANLPIEPPTPQPEPIYCTKCNNTLMPLNCKGKMGKCKGKNAHLCMNCDQCSCGVEEMASNLVAYYRTCRCFTDCAECIALYKGWNYKIPYPSETYCIKA